MKTMRLLMAWSVVGLLASGCGGCNTSDPGAEGDDDDSTNQTGNQDGSYVANQDGSVVLDGATSVNDGGGQADASQPVADAGGKTDGSVVVTDGGMNMDGSPLVDASSPTPDAGAESPDGAVLDDGGTSTGDAGEELDASVEEDGGTVADSGPPPDNHAPVIVDVQPDLDPFVGTTQITVNVTDADNDPVQCQVSTSTVGVTIAPAGFDPSCVVTVTEQAPRQVVTLAVVAKDVWGATAETTFDITIDNHGPAANAGSNQTVLPGEAVSLVGTATDPDTAAPGGDQLTYAWTVVGPNPAGVTLTGATTLTAQLVVDRDTYVNGPEAKALSLQLLVTDDQGTAVSSTVEVMIGDERGPYVDNQSKYAGTGPSGYCGAALHPCNNIPDALVNLASAIADGLPLDPEVKVATTGEDYALDQEVQLNNSMNLTCGYHPETWARTEARTPLRFTGTRGLVVGSSVKIEGCDVEGIASVDPGVMQDRSAILVQAGGVSLVDNRLVGTLAAGSATNVHGVFIPMSMLELIPITIERNTIEGGVASNTATGVESQRVAVTVRDNTIRGGTGTTCLGINVTGPGGTAQTVITGNTISGGRASSSVDPPVSSAVGIQVEGQGVLVESNPSVVGGIADSYAVGMVVGSTSQDVTLRANTVSGGSVEGNVDLAVGLILYAAAKVQNNSLTGGKGGMALGLLGDGEYHAAESGITFSVEGGSIKGGNGTAMGGVTLEDGAHATLDGVDVTVAGLGATPMSSVGVSLKTGATITVNGGGINAGNAARETIGVRAEPTAASITLAGTVVSAGETSGFVPESTSMGVYLQGGSLVVGPGPTGTRSSISAAAAQSMSVGINLSCPAETTGMKYSVEDADVQAGSANVSIGLVASQCAALQLARNTVRSGNSFGDGEGYGSYGAFMDGSKVTGAVVSSTSDTFQTGSAPHFNVGFYLLGSVLSAKSITVQSGVAGANLTADALSYGMMLVDASESSIQGGSVSAGEARGSNGGSLGVGLSADSTPTIKGISLDGVLVNGGLSSGWSEGLAVLGASDGLNLTGCTLSGGDAGLVSVGLGVGGDGASTLVTHQGMVVARNQITSGTVTADNSILTSGLRFDYPCVGCLVERNFMTAGTSKANTSRSVGLRAIFRAAGMADQTTYFINNRVVAGESPNSRGVEMDGNAGDSVVWLHNNIHAGGQTGGFSAAVYFGSEMVGNGLNVAGWWGANIMDRGQGAESYGYYENCTETLVGTRYAQPMRAVNTNFWLNIGLTPSPSVAYVRDAFVAMGGGCGTALLTSIGDVNSGGAGNPYRASMADGQSWDLDPGFLADRYHVAQDSPMREKAVGTKLAWGTNPMVDIDGDARPNPGTNADIGMDEVK